MRTSSQESAEYIAEMCRQLSPLAAHNKFIDAARSLQMVHLEVTRYCDDGHLSAVVKN